MRLLIDCHAICFASLYKLNGLSYNGHQTGVIYGFLNKLQALVAEYKPDTTIFCWDSRKSFRKKVYPEYKANRKDKTEEQEELLSKALPQFHELRDNIIPRLGFRNNFLFSGYEADDIIALCVYRHPDDYVIASGDSDLFQLLEKTWNYETSMHNIHTGKKFTYDQFRLVYNIEPRKWAKAKAIGGCVSDHVEGIHGAADPAKSESSKALEYLRGNLTKGKIFDLIESEEGRRIITRNLQLVALPFVWGEEPCVKIQQDELYTQDFLDVFRDYGFRSFREKFDEWKELFKLRKGRREEPGKEG